MTVFQCIVMTKDETRCLKTTETNLPVSPNFRYVCSHHTREEQLQVLSRPYDPVKDEADRDVHFQDFQFDEELASSGIPVGTEHIHRQGSNNLNPEKVRLESNSSAEEIE